MAENNIYVKITAEDNLSDVQLQLRETTNRAKELEKQMAELDRKEKEDAETLRETIKEEKNLAKALAENAQYYQRERKIKQEDINVIEKSIASYKKQVKSMQTMQGAGQRMTMQLRAMRDKLQEMEDAGLGSSKEFIDLSIQAGKLADQIGDTQQRISILASDTRDLDAAMSVGSGLTGVFNIATSSAELFGGEMEGLQMAFYKVQGALSILYGLQQLENMLNKDSAAKVVILNAVEEVAARAKENRSKAEAKFTKNLLKSQAAQGLAAIKTGAIAVANNIAAAAQWAWNAAMYANPLVAIIALVVAAAAGIYALAKRLSAAGQAQHDLNKTQKQYEKDEAKRHVAEIAREHAKQKIAQETSNAKDVALRDAKKRLASEVEIAQIELDYAKQEQQDNAAFFEEEKKQNDEKQAQLKRMMDAQATIANSYGANTKKRKKALEELAEREQAYYDAVKEGEAIEQTALEKQNAVLDAEQELADAKKEMAHQTTQANIDLMREGASKEIRQIEANYKEQLEKVQGNTDEEIALRKALEAKKAREISNVRRKYNQQAQQEAIQEQKNLLAAMSQSRGTEADYAQEIALTKAVAEQEAQARIAALDKMTMSDKAYANEVEAIRLELAASLKQIDDQEAERKANLALKEADNQVKAAQTATERLRGKEGAEGQLQVWNEYYNARQSQIEQQANADIAAVQRSTQTEEEKAAAIKGINEQMNADLLELSKERAQKEVDVNFQSITQISQDIESIQNRLSKNTSPFGKWEDLQALMDAQMKLYEAQQQRIETLWKNGAITFEEYQQQMYEIHKDSADSRYEYEMEKMQAVNDGFSQAMDNIQKISNMVFDALQSNVQAELDALEKNYTTDAEEAKKDSNKKLISEKEYEKKKQALELKAAKYRKAQALTDIAIQTSLAIVSALTTAPPFSFIAAGIAGTMGAAQLAIAAAKPLAQYEKGRKGGQGEYAIVGERGAELMYIPQGASIVPNNKLNTPEAWGEYGVPSIAIPQMPNVADSTITSLRDSRLQGVAIDYDRLGAAVAQNIPEYKQVSVSVDRSGITVTDGLDTRRYLNRKYAGAWN